MPEYLTISTPRTINRRLIKPGKCPRSIETSNGNLHSEYKHWKAWHLRVSFVKSNGDAKLNLRSVDSYRPNFAGHGRSHRICPRCER